MLNQRLFWILMDLQNGQQYLEETLKEPHSGHDNVLSKTCLSSKPASKSLFKKASASPSPRMLSTMG